jgi:hypothetical protein
MLADKDQIGRMTLCGNCLLSFPVPNSIASLPASAESKPTPRPTPEEDGGEIVLSQRGSEPGWQLVRLGLTLLVVSSIVLMAGGFIGVLFSGSQALARPFSPENPPVVIIAAFIAMTAAVTGFIGMCLCCAIPAGSGLCFLIRATVVFLLAAGVIYWISLVLTNVLFLELPAVREILKGLAFCAGFAGAASWQFFLKGIADYFGNRDLDKKVDEFAFFLFTLNFCLITPCLLLFSLLLSHLLLFVPIMMLCTFFGCHLRLVVGIRDTIPFRNQHSP